MIECQASLSSIGSGRAERNRNTFLYLYLEDKIVGGICGGLGDYSGVDPILVGIMWVVLTLGTAATGLLAYAARGRLNCRFPQERPIPSCTSAS